METQTDLSVANEIRLQIGPTALFMLGAKNLTGDVASLSFRIGRNSHRVTHLRIVLEPSDCYTVQAIRVRGSSVRTVETRDDVDCESLASAIRELTGMETRMPQVFRA
jgi:hypothetical protein